MSRDRDIAPPCELSVPPVTGNRDDPVSIAQLLAKMNQPRI